MAIIFDKVAFKYNKEYVLEDINYTFEENKAYGIIGPSGSGKTTLVKMMNGLLKPTKGLVKIDKTEITSTSKINPNLRKKVSIIFQFSDESFFEETVYKELEFGLKNLNLSTKTINKRITDIIDTLGLDQSILSKNPFKLSDGEKKLISIAAILIIDPKVLILDEPTVNLDYKSKEILRKLLVKLRRKKTIIIISHDVNFIHKVVDEVVVLKDGFILTSGNKYEVFKNEKDLKKNNIAVPDIISFTNLVNKKTKIDYYDDIKELMKAVYRDVN